MATKRKAMSDCPEMDYFMNESVSDVVFVIEGQRLPADKHFLSIRNKVFRAMFSDNFRESKDKEVVIKDTTFEAFKTLIEFIYTDELVLKDCNDFKLIDEICKLSDRYEVKRLMDRIVLHLKSVVVTFDNIELISRIADSSDNKELIEKRVEFINENLNKIIDLDDNQLFELNDSTDNHILKGLANNYQKVKQELEEVSTKLSKVMKRVCQNCKKYQLYRCYTSVITIYDYNHPDSLAFTVCPNCKSEKFKNIKF